MDGDGEFCLFEELPTVQELIDIRKAVGWGERDYGAAKVSLANCLYSVCIRHEDKLVGLGRVVGDGGLYYYIQDVVVLPEFQGRGLGAAIMDKVMAHLRQQVKPGAVIGLLAAKGKEPFYEKYGFIARPTDMLGNGMCQFVTRV
jgi:ribosomal protein S18 acetylase RimI-like enzyme